MRGFETSIYFMMAMMFVGMPTAVIGGIAWECRKRTRVASEETVDGLPVTEEAPAPPAKPR